MEEVIKISSNYNQTKLNNESSIDDFIDVFEDRMYSCI